METPFPVDRDLPLLKPGRKEGINTTARMLGLCLPLNLRLLGPRLSPRRSVAQEPRVLGIKAAL